MSVTATFSIICHATCIKRSGSARACPGAATQDSQHCPAGLQAGQARLIMFCTQLTAKSGIR